MAAPAKTKKRDFFDWLHSYTGQKYTTTLLFLLIPIILMILFTVIPAANMFIFSFQDRDQFGVNPEWVGLDNYKTIFTDTSYLSTFHSCAVMLKDKVCQSFQGYHLFPVYDERCCGIAHLPPLLPERRRYNKHRGYAQQHHTDVRRRSGKVAFKSRYRQLVSCFCVDMALHRLRHYYVHRRDTVYFSRYL